MIIKPAVPGRRAPRKLSAEGYARFFVLGLLLGLLVILAVSQWIEDLSLAEGAVEIHARMSETGGWAPADLAAVAGQPIRLRLTSDDVMHGFAVGQTDWSAVDVKPGAVSEVTLTFAHPGKYTYYCTRWCGLNHWRMRGTIEVSPNPSGGTPESALNEGELPLFVTMGIDIDAARQAEVLPDRKPSAVRGAALGVELPPTYLEVEYYRKHTPEETWQALREDPVTLELSDQAVWDLVALVWRSNTTPQALALGKELYAQNCSACHGEAGGGDGVMAEKVRTEFPAGAGHGQSGPVDFTNLSQMLATSPAIQQGKIVRGGMGTGMPYWGPVFTEAQGWALVDTLWTFPFEMD